MAKRLKFFSLNIRKKLWKKNKKNYFSRNFYSEHVDRVLRTMPRVYAENPKRFKTFKSFFKPKIVRLHTQMLVLTTSRSFFWPEVWKIFRSNSEKTLKRKTKKTILFRNFYSGHVDRNLRTTPKVSAANPKRFKTLKKVQATNCSSGHAKGSFDDFLKFFGQTSEIFFAQHPKKVWKEK